MKEGAREHTQRKKESDKEIDVQMSDEGTFTICSDINCVRGKKGWWHISKALVCHNNPTTHSKEMDARILNKSFIFLDFWMCLSSLSFSSCSSCNSLSFPLSLSVSLFLAYLLTYLQHIINRYTNTNSDDSKNQFKRRNYVSVEAQFWNFLLVVCKNKKKKEKKIPALRWNRGWTRCVKSGYLRCEDAAADVDLFDRLLPHRFFFFCHNMYSCTCGLSRAWLHSHVRERKGVRERKKDTDIRERREHGNRFEKRTNFTFTFYYTSVFMLLLFLLFLIFVRYLLFILAFFSRHERSAFPRNRQHHRGGVFRSRVGF